MVPRLAVGCWDGWRGCWLGRDALGEEGHGGKGEEEVLDVRCHRALVKVPRVQLEAGRDAGRG